MNLKNCILIVIILFPKLSCSQENERKIELEFGSLIVPKTHVLFDPNHCSYWKAVDESLKTQMSIALQQAENGYLIVDTTNVYNHIVVYSRPFKIIIDEKERRTLEQVYGESSIRNLPEDYVVDYRGCTLHKLRNYNYVKSVTYVSSKTSGLHKFSNSYVISNADKTVVFTFQSPFDNSDEIFKTFEFN